MQYLCLVYHEETKLAAMTEREHEAFVSELLACDEELRRSAYALASAPLEPAQPATIVRVRNGMISVGDEPCAEASARLGWFYLINARDLNEAIRVAARLPPARLGYVEVRPIKELAPG